MSITATIPPDPLTEPLVIAQLEALIDDLLTESRRLGATSAEAGISTGTGLDVNVRLGNVETIEHTRDKGLGVTVYVGHKKGSASTTDFSPSAVKDTVAAACRIAKYTAEDDCAGLADKKLMASNVPDLDLHHPWDISVESAIDLALETETSALGLDARISNSEGAGVSQHESSYVYGNSHGFLAGFRSSRHSISCSVIAEDDSGMQRDDWYSVARNANALEDARTIGSNAARRSLARLGSRKLSTRSVPVLFQAEVARGLFQHFTSAIRGGSLYRKASFLLDHLGKQVFPSWLRIHEQPHLQRALGSSPFDNEGVATGDRDLVTAGILCGYVLDSYTARKLDMHTTGNAGGVHNLTVAPGNKDFSALLKTMGTGLLVNELMGMGINTVTGDYSRGAAGFWVEGGEIQYTVEEITIAGNLRDMFLEIAEVGTDIDTRGNVRTGSVLVERMTVAGE